MFKTSIICIWHYVEPTISWFTGAVKTKPHQGQEEHSDQILRARSLNVCCKKSWIPIHLSYHRRRRGARIKEIKNKIKARSSGNRKIRDVPSVYTTTDLSQRCFQSPFMKYFSLPFYLLWVQARQCFPEKLFIQFYSGQPEFPDCFKRKTETPLYKRQGALGFFPLVFPFLFSSTPHLYLLSNK